MIDPLIGGSVISGIGNVIGGLFGVGSQSDTNRMNLQIMREQNAFNERMLHEQQQFAVDQWNRQNEYNLPKNVAQRLLEAGINPASMSGASATPAGAVGLPTAVPAAGAVMNPLDYQGVANNVTNSFESYFRNRNLQAQSQKTETESNRYRQMTPWEIKQLQMLVRKGGIEGDLAKTELTYQQAIQGEKISQAFGDTRLQQKSLMLMDKDMLQKELQNKLLDVQLSYAPRLNDAQLTQYYATVRQIKAQIGLLSEQTNLTAEQRLNEAQRRIGIIVDNGMKGLDFQIKRETKNVSIDLLREELYEKEDLRMLRPLDAYQRHLGKAANYSITPGASQLVGSMIERDMKRERFYQGGYGDSYFRPRFQR